MIQYIVCIKWEFLTNFINKLPIGKKGFEGKNVWDGHPDGMLEILQTLRFFPPSFKQETHHAFIWVFFT